MSRRKFYAAGVYNKLMIMAKNYGVDKNPLFVAAANQYQTQQLVIERIREEIEIKDRLTVTKTYSGEHENEYVNPLIKDLPKHSEAANRTAQTMLAIINELGVAPVGGEKMSAFDKKYK